MRKPIQRSSFVESVIGPVNVIIGTPHDLRCRVYVTMRCPSVCLSVPSFDRISGVRQVRDSLRIDSDRRTRSNGAACSKWEQWLIGYAIGICRQNCRLSGSMSLCQQRSLTCRAFFCLVNGQQPCRCVWLITLPLSRVCQPVSALSAQSYQSQHYVHSPNTG